MSIKISKVEIRIGKEVLSLNLKELKDLRDILNETFPENVPFVIIKEKEHVDGWWNKPSIPWYQPTYCTADSFTAKVEDNIAVFNCKG